jgi:SnoaL-like domain
MDAQSTMRLMFDTMDAYDRADFDRLAEIYAEDAPWFNADPRGPHCRNRDDVFRMFRQRMDSGIRVTFDEMRSTPTHVILTARVDGSDPGVTVFTFEGRRIVAVQDYPSMRAAEAALAPARASLLGRFGRFIGDLSRRLSGQRPAEAG